MADFLSAAAPAPTVNATSPLAAAPPPNDDTSSINTTNPTTTIGSASNSKPPPKNDGASSAHKKSKANNGNDPPLRQGKWTREEEEYVHCLIDEFKTGMMPLAEGTSLRTFLSKMLGCHPMRISKKFVGSNYNGKQVYARRTGADRLSNEEVRERRAKLCDLERKFLAKIGSSKSANTGGGNGTTSCMDASAPASTDSVLNMQSAAMAAAAAGGTNGLNLQSTGGASGVSVSPSGVELRNLINQVAVSQTQKQQQQQQQQMGGNHNSEFTRNLSSMFEVSLNDQSHHPSSASHQNSSANSASNRSLQNIFQGLLASSGSNNDMNSNGSRNNINACSHDNNHNSFNGGSLEAFQALMQQQQNNAPRPNSRAAAAGRALLQSGSGLGLGGLTAKPPSPRSSSSNEVSKPLSAFTDDELAEELRKRSSLRKIMNSLGMGGGNNSSSDDNMYQNRHPTSFAAGLQDSLQQAADANNSNAISSLIRNTSVDMSNLIERQGSIDSLSNLAIRSRLQSIQSMGSLFDPLLGDGGENMGGGNNTGTSGNSNSSWTGGSQQGGGAIFSQLDLSNLGGRAAKASQDNMGSFSSSRRTANELMQSLGMSGASLNNFTNSADSAAASHNAGSRPASSSGLNFASLLNNEEALRRLEASAPSSLNQNFSFQHQDNNGGSRNNGASQQQSQQSNDNNTAIAQFLLQKKLMEAQNGDGNNNNRSNSDQQQLMMNVAAAASCNTSSGNGNSGGGLDPFMSSLLSSLRSSNGDDKQQLDDMDSLKRKFLSQDALSGQDDEQRRTKSFR